MNYDIFQTIISLFDSISDKIKICNLNKENYMNVKLYDLLNIPNNLLVKIDQKVIEQYKFNQLREINVNNNPKVKSLWHLRETLEIIKCKFNESALDVRFQDLNCFGRSTRFSIPRYGDFYMGYDGETNKSFSYPYNTKYELEDLKEYYPKLYSLQNQPGVIYLTIDKKN